MYLDVGAEAGGFLVHCAATGCWLDAPNKDQEPRSLSSEVGMAMPCQSGAFKVPLASRRDRCLTSPASSLRVGVMATTFGFMLRLSRICLQNRTDHCESAKIMSMAPTLHPFYHNKIR